MALNIDADVKLFFYIEEKLVEVDIDESTSFSFNMGESDITEPAAVETGFSYQCSLPKTQNNDQIFNHIAKYDARLYSFSAIKRNDFYLYVYGVLSQTGFFVLEEITKTEYKIRLYGGLGDLFWELSQVKMGLVNEDSDKEADLIPMDYGDDFNFTINQSNVWSNMTAKLNTTTNSFNDRVRFFLSYQGEYSNFDSEHYTKGNEAEEDIPECTWNEKDLNVAYGSPELNENRRSFQVSVSETATQIRGQYVSYYQQFAFRAKYMLQKIFDYAEKEVGWKINLDEHFFNDDNPYWNDLFIGGGNFNVIETVADATIMFEDVFGYKGKDYDTTLGVNWMGSAHETDVCSDNTFTGYRNYKWSDDTCREYIPVCCNVGCKSASLPLYEHFPTSNNKEISLYPETYNLMRTESEDNMYAENLYENYGISQWSTDMGKMIFGTNSSGGTGDLDAVTFPIDITNAAGYEWSTKGSTKLKITFNFMLRYVRPKNFSGGRYQSRMWKTNNINKHDKNGKSSAWYGQFDMEYWNGTSWVSMGDNATFYLVGPGEESESGLTGNVYGVTTHQISAFYCKNDGSGYHSHSTCEGDAGVSYKNHGFYCYKTRNDDDQKDKGQGVMWTMCPAVDYNNGSHVCQNYDNYIFTLEGTGDFTNAIQASSGSVVKFRIKITNHPNYFYRYNGANYNYDWLPIIRPLKSGMIEVFDGTGGAIRSGKVLSADDFVVNLSCTALDFLLSYCKPFNLRFLKNLIKKEVTIMPYNEFYTGESLDYTNKVDYSQSVTQNPVLLDYCKGILSFGGVEDKYSENYLSQTDRQYGSMVLRTGYEINKDEKEYFSDNIFKNFVLARGYSNYYMGRYSDLSIYADNKQLAYLEDIDGGKVDSVMILGFLSGGLDVDNLDEGSNDGHYIITDDTANMIDIGYMWGIETISRRTVYYTLKNSIQNSDGENFSLYFGEPKTLFNTIEDHSSGTIYLRYWQDYLADQLDQNTKVLKCNIIFDPFEVNWELFRKFYVINNSTWILTDISGFNPLSNGSTTCTFLRVNDIFNYTRLGDFIITNKEDNSIVYQYSENITNVIEVDENAHTIKLNFYYEKASVWGDWQLVEMDDDMTFTPTSGGENTDVTITIPTNKTKSSKYYEFCFYWRGDYVCILITQATSWEKPYFVITDYEDSEDVWYLWGLDEDDPDDMDPYVITDKAPESNPYSLTASSQTLHFNLETNDNTQGWTLESSNSSNFKISVIDGAIGQQSCSFDVAVAQNTSTTTRSFNLSFTNVDPAMADGLYFTQAAGSTPTPTTNYRDVYMTDLTGETLLYTNHDGTNPNKTQYTAYIDTNGGAQTLTLRLQHTGNFKGTDNYATLTSSSTSITLGDRSGSETVSVYSITVWPNVVSSGSTCHISIYQDTSNWFGFTMSFAKYTG